MTQRVTAGTSVTRKWLSLRVLVLRSVHTPFVSMVLSQFLLITAHSGELVYTHILEGPFDLKGVFPSGRVLI